MSEIQFQKLWRESLSNQLGIELEEILAPIDEEFPTGTSYRGNGVYHAIKEARREDDPNLPQGVWTHDLKKADWETVTEISIDALKTKTKDLQLGFWLLEAQIHQYSFAAIAPCMLLLKEMCQTYWDNLFPEIQDDDIEYRINPIIWANEKLQPVIRLLPITRDDKKTNQYCWADWEMGKRHDQLRSTGKNISSKKAIGTHEIMQSVAATPVSYYQQIYYDIYHGLLSIDDFINSLDRLTDHQAPTLNGITSLLQEIMAMVGTQCQHRGVNLTKLVMSGSEEEETPEQPGPDGEGTGGAGDNTPGGGSGNGSGGGPISSRAEAYARLSEAADFLMRLEPHSPAPYLVRRAIEWGNLNTAELYHELFIEYQGQLNIFDLLGLQSSDKQEKKEE